ncbi:MAG TPA: ABC transporter permease subunit [Planctomycetota bacterium]|nr:ABC transporter permease subunit [Planctomycetota bacterium]
MSRPLCLAALAALFFCGLAPICAMLPRVELPHLLALSEARSLALLGRTLLLGISSATLALAIGLPFGLLTTLTDLPGARWLRSLSILPLILPPIFLAITWTQLSDLRGAPATVLLLAAATFPLPAVFTARAAQRIDCASLEAARLAGGTGAALGMALPLVLPPALCGAALAFVFTVNDFAVPDFVSSVGPKFNVYADEVFSAWQTRTDTGAAVAAALPLVTLTLLALVPALALRRRGAFATIGRSGASGGCSPRPSRPLPLGPRGKLLCLPALALVVATALLPLGRLVFEAGGGPRGWSLTAWREAFSYAIELCRANLITSISCAALAATLSTFLALVLGHALERLRRRTLARALELTTLLPLAVPAVLFGIGEIVLWNRDLTAGLYNSPALIVLLFTGRFLPLAILVCAGAVASLGRELEESAALSGAGPIRRLFTIVAPPLLPALSGAWILVFVLAMRELDAAILVPAANSTVIFRIFNAIHFGRDDFVAALCLISAFVTILPALLWGLFSRRSLRILP